HSFAVSTTDWMASERMAALPVTPATMNFATAMPALGATAAKTTFLDSPDASDSLEVMGVRRRSAGRPRRHRADAFRQAAARAPDAGRAAQGSTSSSGHLAARPRRGGACVA